MPEGRMLKKRISDSKSLGVLRSDSARLLYTWLIPHLDVEGRHSADVDIIKGHIFPKIKTMTIGKIQNLLTELHEQNLIILFRDNSETFLQLVKFHNYQKINRSRESESKITEPTEENIIPHDNSGSNPEKGLLSKIKVSKLKESLSKDKVSLSSINQIIEYLNKKTGKTFSPDTDQTQKHIRARLKEGKTVEDFKHVIDVKIIDWGKTVKMKRFLRPDTLFRPANFEDYLNEEKELTPQDELEAKYKKGGF